MLARLSGVEFDDEDLEEVEKLEELKSAKELDLWTRIKKGIFDLVQRMGFFGILVCASVYYSFDVPLFANHSELCNFWASLSTFRYLIHYLIWPGSLVDIV